MVGGRGGWEGDGRAEEPRERPITGGGGERREVPEEDLPAEARRREPPRPGRTFFFFFRFFFARGSSEAGEAGDIVGVAHERGERREVCVGGRGRGRRRRRRPFSSVVVVVVAAVVSLSSSPLGPGSRVPEAHRAIVRGGGQDARVRHRQGGHPVPVPGKGGREGRRDDGRGRGSSSSSSSRRCRRRFRRRSFVSSLAASPPSSSVSDLPPPDRGVPRGREEEAGVAGEEQGGDAGKVLSLLFCFCFGGKRLRVEIDDAHSIDRELFSLSLVSFSFPCSVAHLGLVSWTKQHRDPTLPEQLARTPGRREARGLVDAHGRHRVFFFSFFFSSFFLPTRRRTKKKKCKGAMRERESEPSEFCHTLPHLANRKQKTS